VRTWHMLRDTEGETGCGKPASKGRYWKLASYIGDERCRPVHVGPTAGMRALRATKRLELQGRLVPVPDGVETGLEVYHGKLGEKPDGKPREKPTAINQVGSGGLSWGLLLVRPSREGETYAWISTMMSTSMSARTSR